MNENWTQNFRRNQWMVRENGSKTNGLIEKIHSKLSTIKKIIGEFVDILLLSSKKQHLRWKNHWRQIEPNHQAQFMFAELLFLHIFLVCTQSAVFCCFKMLPFFCWDIKLFTSKKFRYFLNVKFFVFFFLKNFQVFFCLLV